MGVVWLYCQEFVAFFDVNGPETKPHDSELFVTFGFYIIIIKPLYGHILNIGEGLHVFDFKLDGNWLLVSDVLGGHLRLQVFMVSLKESDDCLLVIFFLYFLKF